MFRVFLYLDSTNTHTQLLSFFLTCNHYFLRFCFFFWFLLLDSITQSTQTILSSSNTDKVLVVTCSQMVWMLDN